MLSVHALRRRCSFSQSRSTTNFIPYAYNDFLCHDPVAALLQLYLLPALSHYPRRRLDLVFLPQLLKPTLRIANDKRLPFKPMLSLCRAANKAGLRAEKSQEPRVRITQRYELQCSNSDGTLLKNF
jgi:hypothetical protein